MPIDPIIHCLQELTDYDAFERLCSAIMNGLGYDDIEPIGGKSDKGRDALFTSNGNGRSTIFAYTVRQDWKVKLDEDCKKVKKHAHPCDEFVYVTTTKLTSDQRDKAVEQVQKDYKFPLKIYGLERLRVQLVGNQRHLIPKHPQIFTWPYFEFRGGQSTAFGRDLLLLDYNVEDHAFALWLARRLAIQGYSVWCFGIAPMAGDTVDETVRVLIENRAAKYIPVFSPDSLSDADFRGRVSLAQSTLAGLILPTKTDNYDSSLLPSSIREIEAADFSTTWGTGLRAMLNQLDALQIPKKINSDRGQQIALQSFIPEPLTKPETETIWTNSFPVTHLPESLTIYRSMSVVKNSALREVEDSWAYSRIDGRTFAAFEPPPKPLCLTAKQEFMIGKSDHMFGKRPENAIKEILGRRLRIKGLEAGLIWCKDREILYFPSDDNGPQRSIGYTTAGGKKSTVAVTGFRQWGSGEHVTKFFYQLAPFFRILVSQDWETSVVLRVYVRVTDDKGELFEGKAINRRRKKVTKSWWNDHFLARVLGIIQYFSHGTDEICMGSDENEIRIATRPMTWDCPVSIDEEAVDRVGDFQDELAALSDRQNWFDEDESDGEEQA